MIFYLLGRIVQKTCQNGSNMSKNIPKYPIFDIIWLYSTLFDFKKGICFLYKWSSLFWPDLGTEYWKKYQIFLIKFPQLNNLPKLNKMCVSLPSSTCCDLFFHPFSIPFIFFFAIFLGHTTSTLVYLSVCQDSCGMTLYLAWPIYSDYRCWYNPFTQLLQRDLKSA